MSFILLGILNAQAEAAGIESDYELLETQILSSSAASVTFTGLGSYTDYKHLQVRAVVATTASGGDALGMRINGDTGNNYSFHELGGAGSSVFSNAQTSVDSIPALVGVRQNLGGVAFAAGVIDILDFSSTTKNKTVRSLSGQPSTDSIVLLSSGMRINTEAITSLFFDLDNGNIAANSRISLYGLKESV